MRRALAVLGAASAAAAGFVHYAHAQQVAEKEVRGT